MNGRIMEQASYADWIHTLRVETYSPLQSLHLHDCFPMPGALLGQETVYADAHGNFSIAVREKVTLRCGFTLYADEPKYVSLILTSDTVCKVWQEQRVINLFKVCSPVLTVRLKRGENVFFADVTCRVGRQGRTMREGGTDGAGSPERIFAGSPSDRSRQRKKGRWGGKGDGVYGIRGRTNVSVPG